MIRTRRRARIVPDRADPLSSVAHRRRTHRPHVAPEPRGVSRRARRAGARRRVRVQAAGRVRARRGRAVDRAGHRFPQGDARPSAPIRRGQPGPPPG